MNRPSAVELRARLVVASIQALVMVVAVAAFFARVFELEIPPNVEVTLKWGVTLVSAPTLVIGALLCLRLENSWRWLGLLVLLIDIAAYVGAGFAESEARRNQMPQERLRQVQALPAYQRLEAELVLASKDLELLVARTATIPADFRTVALELEEAKRKARLRTATLREDLGRLESRSSPATTSEPAAASDWLTNVTVLGLAIANELLAYVLFLHSRRGAPAVARHGPVKQPTVEDYRLASQQSSRGVRPGGYRAVARKLGISEHHSRQLMIQARDSETSHG